MSAPPQFANSPDQPLSVPRRALDIEDYIDILRRHRSWILGPAFVGLVASVVIAFLLPNVYVATGMIRVVPPQVPSRLVQTNLTEEMTVRVQAIYQNIVSRQSLQNIIQTYNLYPDDRKRLPTEDVMDQMRRDINLGTMQYMSRGVGSFRQNVNAFGVSFNYADRRIAQKVCSDLISRFIDESIKSRSTQSLMTTEFFKDQYESAKRELDEIDSKITAFRSRSMGELPEQEQMVISRISAMEASITATNSQISRAQEAKISMEAQIRDLRDQMQVLSQGVQEQINAPTAQKNERLAEMDREIDKTEATLNGLRQSYKDSHPDVQRVLAHLRDQQKQRDLAVREAESQRVETPTQRSRTVVPAANQAKAREVSGAIQRIQLALQFKDNEIEELNRQLSDTRTKLRSTQARLESSPAANQEYVQLQRERALLASRYEELGRKMQDSAMSTDLESRKQGEMLEILETPAIPEEPVSPKRPLIIGMGLVLGIGLGITLAGAREIRDSSLKNLKDVRAYTKLTVLGSVPLLENDFVVRRRRRLGWLAWSATFLLGALLMAGSAVYYFTSKA
jgi:polysaccharide chain length determinant protein (PEP-CTERM system associated)